MTVVSRKLWVGILLYCAMQSALADLAQEMDSMFGSMTNVTSPTAHLGQRRGVLTGGGVVSRNRIVNTNAISFVPPSFNAGCGGIDLFAGSFSFINFSQFVQLMRSVAANASGYAFQLAVGAMCPWCASVMSDLQKKIQEMNQLMSNSCRLSQGLVNDTVRAFDLQSQASLSNASFTRGLGDVFSSWTSSSSLGDPLQQVKQNLPADLNHTIQGNLVWRALVEQNAGAWFRFGGTSLLEAAMSVSGTVIIDAPESAPDGMGESNTVRTPPPVLSIRDLMDGSPVNDPYQQARIYVCSDGNGADQCLKPQLQVLTLTGMKQRVLDILLGPAGAGGGLIDKFSTNTGQITDSEMAFMQTVPDAVGAMVRNLAREDAGIARIWAEEAAPVIALDMTRVMVRDLFTAVRTATRLSDHAYARLLMDALETAQNQIHEESATIAGRYGNPQTLMAFYQQLMMTLRPGQYGEVEPVPSQLVGMGKG